MRACLGAAKSRYGPPLPMHGGRGTDQPLGQAVGLCRDLHASGVVDRIVILRHPSMPAWLLSAVSKILQTAGLPVDIEETK